MTKTNDNKKLFLFLKSSRRDQQGIPPLKQKLKPTFLISNLTQYLPPKEPLSLSRLAKMRVQDLKTAGGLPSDTIPDLQQDTTTEMPEIDISKNGLHKLLKNLKPGKAAGPEPGRTG